MAPTFKDLGNGFVEVDVGGKPARMRMDPAMLRASGFEEVAWGPSAGPAMSFSPATPAPTTPLADPLVEAGRKAAEYDQRKQQEAAAFLAAHAPAPQPEIPEAPIDMGAGGAGPIARGKPPTQTAGKPAEGAGGVGPGAAEVTAVTPAPKVSGAMPAPGAAEAGGPMPFLMGGGGGGGPARPRGLIESKRDVEGTEYAPGALKDWAASRFQQAEDQSAGYLQMAEAYQVEAEKLRKEAAEQNSVALQRRAKLNEALANWAKDADDVSNMRVDPNKYWADRGVLGSLLAAVAAGAGAYASTVAGGPNYALSIINAGIDREIDAQKSNIMARQHGLQTKMTLLDRYMQSNDPETAEALSRATLKESIATQLRGSEAAAMAGQVRSSAQADVAQVALKASETKVTKTMAQPPMNGGGGGVGGVSLTTLMDATGYNEQDAQRFAQVNPTGARKITMDFLMSQASARGKQKEGPGKLGSRTATKIAMAGAALDNTNELLDEFKKNPVKANIEARKEGTPLNALFKRLVFNQTHVASAGPSGENIELLTHELMPPGVTSFVYGSRETIRRLERNKHELEKELSVYEQTRGGPGQGSEESGGEK